jgi:hypothetical protein
MQKGPVIFGMGAKLYAAARYGTKGIGFDIRGKNGHGLIICRQKTELMFGTAVNARSVERWSMCTTRTAFASTAGRAR